MKLSSFLNSCSKLCRTLLILSVPLFSMLSCTPREAVTKASYVVLSPEVAEILAALGASDEISGVTVECDYPPQLGERVIVGNFGAIDKEKVLALEPKIVFTSALEQEAIATDLRKLGIEVVSSYPKNLDEMLSEIFRLGEIVGRQSEAKKLVESLQTEIGDIGKATENSGKKPKVYLEIYREPLMSVSDESLVGELINHSGGENIFRVLERDYSRINPEEVIKAMPDIMICYSRDSLENIVARKGWHVIPAIKNQQIYFEEDISPDILQRASPRSIQGMKELAKIYQKWREAGL